MKTLHLICNAHIDPVWQWEWEEGAAEAVSTFRVAADLAEEQDGFVFNHNEALLYRWIEDYEPALFARIQKLVKAGRWHIMGGWYLQPDCNLPSGESFVRQITLGREYFRSRFGIAPTSAINFDPFGHSRGLVQILAKSGFDSYIFCRPLQKDCALESDDFWWEGFDGSRVKVHRSSEHYNSALGKARDKVEAWLGDHPDISEGLLLWGVGNHGGGPSKNDLKALGELMAERTDVRLVHSTPEAYFAKVNAKPWPVHAGDLNAWAVGCYTSQVRIKQLHRKLENSLFLTEKMAAQASFSGGDYPHAELEEASRTLALAQFHDILPGSSVQNVEDWSLQLMGHGLEILSRVRAKAFFALAAGQARAQEGEIPILVHNPHPYPVDGLWECEFMLADQNWNDEFTQPTVYRDDWPLPTQCEKENSNLTLDWRKRVVFRATLAPASMNRFDVRLAVLPAKPVPELAASAGVRNFRTDRLEVSVNTKTGLLDRYRVDGADVLAPGAASLLAMNDDEDPWAMNVNSFTRVLGRFELMSPEQGTRFSGVRGGPIDSVRLIEDGPVRSVVEAVFAYQSSTAVVHYLLPKEGTEVQVTVRVNWLEKDRMLKLALPLAFSGEARGQTAFGVQNLTSDQKESVFQKWVGVFGPALALTVANEGIYAGDCSPGELRLSLVRSPAYCAHPILDRPLVPTDRFTPRIDQGERVFRVWLNAGAPAARRLAIEREALAHNEAPFALSFFPAGGGELTGPALVVDDPAVVVSALLRSREAGSGGDSYLLRLFEPTGQARNVTVEFSGRGVRSTVFLKGFEVKTFRLTGQTLEETGLDAS